MIETKYEYGRIINGDCLDIMDKLIEEGIKVDCVITDLPYNTTNCKWDKEVINLEEMWKKLNKLVGDNTPIVMFGSQPFTSKLVNSNIKGFKHTWVWHKKNAGNILVAKYQPLKTTEDILVFSKKGDKVNYYPILTTGHKDRSKDSPTKQRSDLFSGFKSGEFKHGNNKKGDERYPKHLIEFSNASRKNHLHPTQKPVPLLEYLIKTYTNEGELVLDITAGSMSLAQACINTNRDFICIEKDEHYYELGVNRISGYIKEI